jgi:putative hydrolase of the HAD superfamily
MREWVAVQPPNLIIDADDTLWEDSIYFEQAIEEFIAFLNHPTLSRQQVRSILDEIEQANTGRHIFGSRAFAENLGECYRRLAGTEGAGRGAIAPQDLDQAMEFGRRLLYQPRQLIAGVVETLDYLAPRHPLILFTKGHPVEQSLKIRSSGLEIFFRHIEITRAKTPETFAGLAARLNLDCAQTWMIGNAPKSDINPALEVGLNAVYIPHAQTWRLEHEEIASGPGRLIVLERFVELREHF